jgi:transcriptional regulator with XRE-family HTH domain
MSTVATKEVKPRGDKTLGARIRSLREMRGMSLRELSTAAEFEYHNLSRLENGRIGYSSDSICRIARALDVTIADLYAQGPPVPINWVPWADPKDTRPLIPITRPLPEGAYAVEVKDDAMDPELLKGDIVIVNPRIVARHGRLVAVRISSEEGVKILIRRAQVVKRPIVHPSSDEESKVDSYTDENTVWELIPNKTTLYESLSATNKVLPDNNDSKNQLAGCVMTIIRNLS